MQDRGLDKMMYKNGTFPTAPKRLREGQFAKQGIKKHWIILKGGGDNCVWKIIAWYSTGKKVLRKYMSM